MKLSEIADRLGGEVLQGDPGREIDGVAGLEDASAGQLAFYESTKYRNAALGSSAGALLVRETFAESEAAQVKVDHPYLRFLEVVRFFHPEREPVRGVHESAVIHPEAVVGKNVSIGPHVTVDAGSRIGNGTILGAGCHIESGARIGEDCRLYSNVVVRADCILGDRCILHPGVVVGSDGFGYVRIPDAQVKIPHVGIVRIEDDVEIGSNSAIDRGTFGETVIEQGAKIDNLVQIGHNVRIGKRTIVCGQSGISGSSTVGNDCVLAGQAGVADHVTIGDNAVLTAQAGVANRVKTGQVVSGTPSIDYKTWLKSSVIFSKLPQLLNRIRVLEKKLKD